MVVVVPIYKPSLDERERMSLASICSVLSARRIVAVHPRGLDFSAILAQFPQLQTMDFEPSMFQGIRGYNRLMTSEQFYEAFADEDYMLVAQLDTYIFRDELDQWCSKGYDYVGAPWLQRPINRLPIVKWIKQYKDRRRQRRGEYSKTALYGRVGNGGLSLRRIDSFRQACAKYTQLLAQLNAQGRKGFPEDVFWATMVEGFCYPAAEEALHFSFDKYPRYSYRLLDRTLPMGCHAWYSRKMRFFWKTFIKY